MNGKRAGSGGGSSKVAGTPAKRVGDRVRVARRDTPPTSSRAPSRAPGPAALTALEERVLRMRKGVAGPDDLRLGRVGQEHPETRARLAEIEARALARSGRLEELREEVGLPVARTRGETKEKIIARLAAKAAESRPVEGSDKGSARTRDSGPARTRDSGPAGARGSKVKVAAKATAPSRTKTRR